MKMKNKLFGENDDAKKSNNIVELLCYNNKITELNNLPSNLIWLYCQNNQLTKLKKLPMKLKILYCFDNNISLYQLIIMKLTNFKLEIRNTKSLEIQNH